MIKHANFKTGDIKRFINATVAVSTGEFYPIPEDCVAVVVQNSDAGLYIYFKKQLFKVCGYTDVKRVQETPENRAKALVLAQREEKKLPRPFIKLTYTQEMMEYDDICEDRGHLSTSKEFETMEKLFWDIITEAESKGFKGWVHINTTDEYVTAQIYKNLKEQEEAHYGGDSSKESDIDWTCGGLLNTLEYELNYGFASKTTK